MSHSSASFSSIKSFCVTRCGDIGMYVLLVNGALFLPDSNIESLYYFCHDDLCPMFQLAIVFAILAKCAQLFCIFWLKSAMEGPTVASAVIHSSTLVVTSVILIRRLYVLDFIA